MSIVALSHPSLLDNGGEVEIPSAREMLLNKSHDLTILLQFLNVNLTHEAYSPESLI